MIEKSWPEGPLPDGWEERAREVDELHRDGGRCDECPGPDEPGPCPSLRAWRGVIIHLRPRPGPGGLLGDPGIELWGELASDVD